MAVTFSDQITSALKPWVDSTDTSGLNGTGAWNSYIQALAAMFEPTWDIVSAQGDPQTAIVAYTSTPLTSAASVVSLVTTPVAQPLAAGTVIQVVAALANVPQWQTFTVAASVAVGATTIVVESETMVYTLAAGSQIQLAYQPGWSELMDVYDCPAQYLPYLGQFVGTTVPPTLDAATARQIVLAESGWRRGTIGAIASAVARNISGSGPVHILERNPTPYSFIIAIPPGQLLAGGVDQIRAAVDAVKPAGLFYTIVQVLWIIAEMEAEYATISAVEAAFVTITGLENDQLGT